MSGEEQQVNPGTEASEEAEAPKAAGNNAEYAEPEADAASGSSDGISQPRASPSTTPPVPSVAPAAVVVKKRGKLVNPSPLDALTAAAMSAAVQQMSVTGYHGLATLLTGALQEPTHTLIPSKEQVEFAARKAMQDQPVWVHWSKNDMAPQFKVDPNRLVVTGALRGYRMARASHGCTGKGTFYFEIQMLPGPTATEIVNSLPPNARLGPGLREQLQKAVEWEENLPKSSIDMSSSSRDEEHESNPYRKRKLQDEEKPPQVGGHVRVGWSMRTGDLQAPVGYDKWSYGIRDTGGSILHCSQRQDHWGGEGFSVDDIIGCAISFEEHDETQNHIRFFKNGNCMGQFVISKGKREGGEAFSNIEPGIYYPAVSCYMGGSVKANFGPHWICPPKRSRLPASVKNLRPVASLIPPPLQPEEAVGACAATIKLFRKTEQQQALKEAIAAEAGIQCQAYEDFLQNHVVEIRKARQLRALSIADLPDQLTEESAAHSSTDPMET